MYIKGISKVLIVITILLSVFLVTPSKVEAAFDAPLTCPKNYTVASDFFGMDKFCCPNTSEYRTLIMAARSSEITSVLSVGQNYRELGSGETQCKVKYYANMKDGSISQETVFEIRGVKATITCPANSCEIKLNAAASNVKRCAGQLERHPYYNDTQEVCCITKKGNVGTFAKVPPCVPDPTVSAAQFNQAPKPIDADEICSKDSGAGNPDDKRSSAEKGRIWGECMDCLKKSNYLWTGVGCMEASLNGVITTIIRIFYGIITALMLLKIIIAGYKYYGGDPEQLKDSKMEIFSAIGAAFALTLGIIALRYIGIDILGLGGIDGVSTGLPILK